MLALSPQEHVNISAVMHYRMEFGKNHVYKLQSRPEDDLREGMKLPPHRRGKILFGDDVTYARLVHAFKNGAEIHTTSLSDQFTYEQFFDMHGESALILFYIDQKGRVLIASDESEITPEPGWSVISLIMDNHISADEPLTVKA